MTRAGILEPGDVIVLGPPQAPGPAYVVSYTNACRAVVLPLERRRVTIGDHTFERPGAPLSIGPASFVRVVGHRRPPKDRYQLPKRRAS